MESNFLEKLSKPIIRIIIFFIMFLSVFICWIILFTTENPNNLNKLNNQKNELINKLKKEYPHIMIPYKESGSSCCVQKDAATGYPQDNKMYDEQATSCGTAVICLTTIFGGIVCFNLYYRPKT